MKYDLKNNKIEDHIKFELGNLCCATAGNNIGRIGLITNIERHPGSFDIVYI